MVNPNRTQLNQSSMDLVLCGTSRLEDQATVDEEGPDEMERVLMIEMEGREVDEQRFSKIISKKNCLNRG